MTEVNAKPSGAHVLSNAIVYGAAVGEAQQRLSLDEVYPRAD